MFGRRRRSPEQQPPTPSEATPPPPPSTEPLTGWQSPGNFTDPHPTEELSLETIADKLGDTEGLGTNVLGAAAMGVEIGRRVGWEAGKKGAGFRPQGGKRAQGMVANFAGDLSSEEGLPPRTRATLEEFTEMDPTSIRLKKEGAPSPEEARPISRLTRLSSLLERYKVPLALLPFLSNLDRDRDGRTDPSEYLAFGDRVGNIVRRSGKFVAIGAVALILGGPYAAGCSTGKRFSRVETVEVPVATEGLLYDLTTPVRTDGFVVLDPGTNYVPFPNTDSQPPQQLSSTQGVYGAMVPEETIRDLPTSGLPATSDDEKVAIGSIGGQVIAFSIPGETQVQTPQVVKNCPDGSQLVSVIDQDGEPKNLKAGSLRPLNPEESAALTQNPNAFYEQDVC